MKGYPGEIKAPRGVELSCKGWIQEAAFRMIQNNLDPTENLKNIHEQFKDAKIILVFGSNWKNIPGAKYINKIGGKIIQPPFYEKLSTANIINTISRNYKIKN